jgi:hypothetical protein
MKSGQNHAAGRQFGAYHEYQSGFGQRSDGTQLRVHHAARPVYDGLSKPSTRTPLHNEGGKENRPKVVRIQVQPDPLAR